MPNASFIASGDSLITRRIAETDDFAALSRLICTADVRFTNLEDVIASDRDFPNAVSGGVWPKAPPGVIQDLRQYGFNLISWANNHTLDYSYGGLLTTRALLNESGIVHAGVGLNLAEAASPRYLECKAARVALIAATSTFHACWLAGDQRHDALGRPGINPVRFTTTFTLPKDKLSALTAIAEAIGVNDDHRKLVADGFASAVDPSITPFGDYRFREASGIGRITESNAVDQQRMLRSIKEARRQADYVLVSLHAHERIGVDDSLPADFIRSFAKECIAAGAHAFIGHGPHILRGIEIYEGRPIFYSLGNFIFQFETVEGQPPDLYDKYDLGWSNDVADVMDERTGNGTRGFLADPKAWQSVLPRWTMEGDRLVKLELFPVELGYRQSRGRRGVPALSSDIGILREIAELSHPFGTEITWKGGVGEVAIS